MLTSDKVHFWMFEDGYEEDKNGESVTTKILGRTLLCPMAFICSFLTLYSLNDKKSLTLIKLRYYC